MYSIFQADVELVVEDGFVYAPLLFDPDVERDLGEAPAQSADRELMEVQGAKYVRALSLEDLLDNYQKTHPGEYERLRAGVLEELGTVASGPTIDRKLSVILFEVMPHFIRKKRGLKRGRFSKEEMLDLVREHLGPPGRGSKVAEEYLDVTPLEGALQRLKARPTRAAPLPRGLKRAGVLREWLLCALEDRAVKDEIRALEEAIENRRTLAETESGNIETLLQLAERGSLEIDGCGFYRSRYKGEYVVYKRTGEYALKDYYGRAYLFPDCRVAVSTWGPFIPVVLDRYKHPFLYREEVFQQVCMRRWSPPRSFSAKAVITTIEEGINSLLYGYNFRRRNGYHSLDRVTMYFRTVDFDDLRVPYEHPKLASGEVRVTNG